MTTKTRVLVVLGLTLFALVPSIAAAQPLGTLRWQLQPYCNVISVVVTGIGGIFSLQGTDDNCGAPRQASVVGTAFQNPDGTIGLGLNIVGVGGTPLQIDAVVELPSANGTWSDSSGNSGTFPFTPGAGTGGPPRPVPSRIVASHAYLSTQTFPASVFLPLTSTGSSTVSFRLTADEPKVLTFSAECSVSAATSDMTAFIDIDVIHNGVTLGPTSGSQDAFCGANGTPAFDGRARPSITLVVPGVVGLNTIRIFGRLSNGAAGGSIGHSALVIH